MRARRSGFGEDDPRPSVVNVSEPDRGAGVAQLDTRGQSPPGFVLNIANTSGSACNPDATASRGRITPSIVTVPVSLPG